MTNRKQTGTYFKKKKANAHLLAQFQVLNKNQHVLLKMKTKYFWNFLVIFFGLCPYLCTLIVHLCDFTYTLKMALGLIKKNDKKYY